MPHSLTSGEMSLFLLKRQKFFHTLHEQAYALYLTCQDWELRHRKINLHFNWSERQNEIGENKVYECYKKKDAQLKIDSLYDSIRY